MGSHSHDRCRICARSGLTRPTSAPGLGSPPPHLRRDCAHPCHICTGTALTCEAIPSPRGSSPTDVGGNAGRQRYAFDSWCSSRTVSPAAAERPGVIIPEHCDLQLWRVRLCSPMPSSNACGSAESPADAATRRTHRRRRDQCMSARGPLDRDPCKHRHHPPRPYVPLTAPSEPAVAFPAP